MDEIAALRAFDALSQTTRLAVFRLLLAAEPDGLAAGEIARRLAVPPNTLSTHLARLAAADLVVAERRGRSIVYRAATPRLAALIDFLTRDCCAGEPEACFAAVPAVRAAPARACTPPPPGRAAPLAFDTAFDPHRD